VLVPYGSIPGQTLYVAAPDGRMISATVPPGIQAGSSFMVGIPNTTNVYNPHYAIPFNNYQPYAPVYDNRDYPFNYCSNYYPHNPNPGNNNNYYPSNLGNSWVPPSVAAGLGAAAIAGTAGLLYTHKHHELDRQAPPPPPPPQPQDFGFSNNLGYINSRDVSASANGQCAPSRDTMTPGNNMSGDDVIGQWVGDY